MVTPAPLSQAALRGKGPLVLTRVDGFGTAGPAPQSPAPHVIQSAKSRSGGLFRAHGLLPGSRIPIATNWNRALPSGFGGDHFRILYDRVDRNPWPVVSNLINADLPTEWRPKSLFIGPG
jgi:hypothetical protein